MQARLLNFIRVLRGHEIRISPAETLDAMAVAETLGYDNRRTLRDGLGMALAKTPEEEAIFLSCFDQYFSQSLADTSGADIAADAAHAATDAEQEDRPSADIEATSVLDYAAQDNPELAELLASPLLNNLRQNNRNELSLAIAQAAEAVSLSDIRMFTQKGQYTRRMLDAMGEEQIRGAIIALEQADSPALGELQRYRDLLRDQVRDAVEREYLLQAKGENQQLMDDILKRTRLSHIEHQYLQKVGELIQKMARKLAARHCPKRRSTKRGQLHMAKTLRRGIANDGVLFNTYWRQVNRTKPQIMAICDVSGSVSAYAKFLLLFLYSLQDVLPRVRSFAFSSHLGEVSALFDEHPVEKAIELVNWRYGGATDYGKALEDFAQLAIDDINNNTTVIVLGDARNNQGNPRLDIMQSIYQRARQVIWLNPESRRAWGTGDSEMTRYLSTCHFSAECNNLYQLERIVEQLLKTTR